MYPLEDKTFFIVNPDVPLNKPIYATYTLSTRRILYMAALFWRVFRLVKLISVLLLFIQLYYSLHEMKRQNSLINLFLETDEVRELGEIRNT